jgi:hypothetical protein
MAGATNKACCDCGKYFPETSDNFRRRPDGSFDVRCLPCRKVKRKGVKKVERAAVMRDIEVGAVSTFVSAATQGGENIPHSCELLERTMEYFGGVSGFSALLVKQYFDSPPGGAARTKMLESIMRLVTKNTEMGGAKKPLGQWTDEELEGELDERLKAIAQQFQGRIVNGTFEKEGHAAAALAIGVESGGVPGEPVERTAGRTRRKKDRGPKAVRADSEAGGDARLPGE